MREEKAAIALGQWLEIEVQTDDSTVEVNFEDDTVEFTEKDDVPGAHVNDRGNEAEVLAHEHVASLALVPRDGDPA